jgi:histidine triad (HIT) family protein
VALAPAGVNLVHATGTAAWQSVFHFHVHVVPRYRPEELQVMWEADRAPDGDLEALRRRILTAGAPLLEDQADSRPAGAATDPG